MRLQLALNVRDIDEAVDYYAKLFDTPPHKRRPGYANFAIDRPPLKLALFEDPNAAERLNHLGVEVFGPADVDAAARRFADAGVRHFLIRFAAADQSAALQHWAPQLLETFYKLMPADA